MTNEQKRIIKQHIRVLEEKTIGKPGYTAPTAEQLAAITAAVLAMEEQQERTHLSFRRHIAVLTYHITHPSAYLFNDQNTADALTAGVQAMKRQVERKMEVYHYGQ